MQIKKKILFILMTIMLTGCSSKITDTENVENETVATEATPESEPEAEEIDYTLLSWQSCLSQLNYDADIAFFGDSITRGGYFQSFFEDQNIINLGNSGDSLQRLTARVKMLASVKPEKVFLMGGINGLKDDSIEQSIKDYEELICSIYSTVPDVKLYIQSVLPISKEKAEICATNHTIQIFNSEIEILAQKYDATYINLFDLYVANGYMNEELTIDGVHLLPEAYTAWADEIKAYIYE